MAWSGGVLARRWARTRPARRRAAFAAGLAGVLVLAGSPGATAADDYRATIDLTFPVAGGTWFTDDYTAFRGNGARRHQATDIFSAKGTPVHAAVAGVVCRIEGLTGAMPSYGYLLVLCGDDGREYGYHHLNNDTPGTDDGRGGPAGAFAAGIGHGTRVERGQVVGYMGDSGNAEDTPVHLHFAVVDRDLHDPRLEPDPWVQGRLNPYPSLVAAQRRGDIPSPASGSGSLRLASPYRRGADVTALQQDLARLGYTGPGGRALVADGVFGPATDAAVRAFQRDMGIEAIGVVGPRTRGALALSLARGSTGGAAPPPAATASAAWPGRYLKLTDPYLRGDDVRRFQARLATLGYRDARGAPIMADGIWGPETDRAARRFIADTGLPDIPIVGPRTWARAFAG